MAPRPKRRRRKEWTALDWLRWMPAQINTLTDGSRAGRDAERVVGNMIRQEIAKRLERARARVPKGGR